MLSPRLSVFVKDMLAMCQSQFPRTCGNCGRSYPTFRSYVESVKPIGVPKIDSIEDEDPIGLMSFGNCPCGSTLTIRCEALASDAAIMHRRFNEALREEETTTRRPVRDILVEMRELLREEALKT